VAAGVGDDHAVLEGRVHVGERERGHGLLTPVVVDDGGEVVVGEGVAADDEEGVVEQALGELDRAGGAERHVLDAVVQAHAERLAVAEVVLDHVGEVLQRNHDLGDAVPFQEQQDVLHHRAIDDGDHRLGPAYRQGPQPRALATGHDDRFHGHLLLVGRIGVRPAFGHRRSAYAYYREHRARHPRDTASRNFRA